MKASSNLHANPRVQGHLRLALGMLQIAGVGMSLALLLFSGVTKLSLAAVVCTCLTTCVSVLLFGSWSKRTYTQLTEFHDRGSDSVNDCAMKTKPASNSDLRELPGSNGGTFRLQPISFVVDAD